MLSLNVVRRMGPSRMDRGNTHFAPAKTVKYKVFAYITHKQRLLIFSHPLVPDAGMQVPAGTLNEGEHPEVAVLREAFEETGLTTLTLASFLGEQVRDMSDFERNEIHHRRFYHLRCDEEPPLRWRHNELFHTDDPSAPPITFEFFWAPLPNEVPHLIADHGIMLPQLLKVL